MNLSDEELIDGCKRRSRKHEELFFKKYYGYVMGISMSYSKSRDLAQEITHDSFLKFFDSVKKLEDTPSVKPWLRRVTVNTAIDYYRRNRKFQNHEEADGETPVFDAEYAPDQLAYEEILKLLYQLPEDHQLVFNLYEVEGYSHKEVAERLEITESSSRVYLTRAKNKLRQLIHIHFKEYAGR
ncbi:MAG: RNA polymerase sigma factor [Algoriphagus aquaeductus]|uniref:RNA polymerase sigma factor n=1 Tax=Algoriphagus aquaeductus TaxID=475299 RepID=UPI0038794DD5